MITGTTFAFDQAVDLGKLLEGNYMVEVIYDDIAHKNQVTNRAIAVLGRQTLIDYIAENLAGMARDVARFAGEERYHDDAITIGHSLREVVEALETVKKNNSLWFYILPE